MAGGLGAWGKGGGYGYGCGWSPCTEYLVSTTACLNVLWLPRRTGEASGDRDCHRRSAGERLCGAVFCVLSQRLLPWGGLHWKVGGGGGIGHTRSHRLVVIAVHATGAPGPGSGAGEPGDHG